MKEPRRKSSLFRPGGYRGKPLAISSRTAGTAMTATTRFHHTPSLPAIAYDGTPPIASSTTSITKPQPGAIAAQRSSYGPDSALAVWATTGTPRSCSELPGGPAHAVEAEW